LRLDGALVPKFEQNFGFKIENPLHDWKMDPRFGWHTSERQTAEGELKLMDECPIAAAEAEPLRLIHFVLELGVIAGIGSHATQFIARDPERPARVELIFSLNLLAPWFADIGRKGEQEILGNALL